MRKTHVSIICHWARKKLCTSRLTALLRSTLLLLNSWHGHIYITLKSEAFGKFFWSRRGSVHDCYTLHSAPWKVRSKSCSKMIACQYFMRVMKKQGLQGTVVTGPMMTVKIARMRTTYSRTIPPPARGKYNKTKMVFPSRAFKTIEFQSPTICQNHWSCVKGYFFIVELM